MLGSVEIKKNMLVTEEGTCGRFYSLITNLPVAPDQYLTEERCLYKHSEICGLCEKIALSMHWTW